MRRGQLGIMLPVVIALLLATPPWAQSAAPRAGNGDLDTGKPVGEIKLLGLRMVKESRVRGRIRTKVGEAYDPAVVRDDVRELLKIRQFQNVWASKQTTVEGKVSITFNVVEYSRLSRVEFIGNKSVPTDELQKLSPYPGAGKDPSRISRAMANIRELYKDRGFYFVSVKIDQKKLDDNNVLTFRIIEGPRVHIEDVEFAGNFSFTDDLLRRQIGTNERWLWFIPAKIPGNRAYYDGEQVRKDVIKLLQFYLRQGFRETRVTRKLDFTADRRRVTVRFIVEEGPRFTIGSWRFEGNKRFTNEHLNDAVAEWFATGNNFTQRRLTKATEAIVNAYGAVGYITARIIPQLIDPAEGSEMTVVFRITEGQPLRIGKINVQGNLTTEGRVARRAMDFYPEQLINMTKIREMQKNIRHSRLFRTAEISLSAVPGKPGYRDITILVEEEERTGSVIFGIGMTSSRGIMGSIIVEERNFSWTDFPESLGHLLSLKSFRGAGQTLRVRLKPGTEDSRFSIDYTDPALFDRRVRMGWSLFYTNYDRRDYDEDRFGFKTSFSSKPTWLKPFIGRISTRLENIDIGGIDALSAADIRDIEGSSMLTALGFGLTLDRRDNAYVPSKGYRLSLNYEQTGVLGGDYTFGRIILDGKLYHTVKTDLLDRKSILSFKTRVGYIAGDAPVFERFFAGGIGSIRGFDFRGIGERQGVNRDNVGGSWLMMANTEYEFPLVGENLRGIVFLDTGTVEKDLGFALRASLGFGLRIVIPQLGPVPISLDLAWPFLQDSEDETQIFQFSIGATF